MKKVAKLQRKMGFGDSTTMKRKMGEASQPAQAVQELAKTQKQHALDAM